MEITEGFTEREERLDVKPIPPWQEASRTPNRSNNRTLCFILECEANEMPTRMF
jgi:hypothetical protein